MDELFKTIRNSCSSLIWSRGVELCRGEGVVGETITDREAVVRVASPERAVSATVKLLFEDEDWLCDCHGKQNPCEHVAAAIIALRRAREQGKSLPVSKIARGIVIYAFTRADGLLTLERKIRVGEEDTPLKSSLSSRISGRAAGPPVSASKEDLAVESVLSDTKRGPVPPSLLAAVLGHLKDTGNVYLDGKKIEVGSTVAGIRALVTDVEDTVRVDFEKDPAITTDFKNGAVIVGGVLRPLKPPPLSPFERELAKVGRLFSVAELPSLAADLLPRLREEMPVEVRSRRLPLVDKDVRPRLIYQTSASGDTLSVLPLIVYGDPPYARIDSGRLVFLGDVKIVPIRNEAAESRLVASLHSEFGLGIGRRVEFRGDAATRFTERLGRSRGAVIGNGLGYFGLKPPLAPSLTFENGEMKVGFSVPWTTGSVDPARVFQAWREGLTRVPLDGGEGWAPIPDAWLEQYGHRVLELLESRNKEGKVADFARPEVARLCDDLEIPCPPQFSLLRRQLETFTEIPHVPIPKDLNATLRPYQQRGVDWLSFLRQSGLGALLADDMGLGKTLQTIAVISGPTLVIAPTSVLPNWQKEIARFRPSLSVSVYHGAGRQLDRKSKVVLTTYAILRIDKDQLSKVKWDCVVLDEAQNIKNPESQAAQAAYAMQAEFRIALTGTPIENRLEDLWSLFHFLNPGLLGGRSDFQKRYASSGLGPARIADLRAKIKPFVLRRLKKEVAPELPPRTDLVLYCELDTEEQIAYETARAAARNEVLESLGSQGNVLAALECLLRLRQAACHPGLLPGHSAPSSSKVKLLLETLEEVVAEDHKALVFSQWTSLLDLIEPHLKAAGLKFCRIDGSTQNRAAVVDKFQDPGGPPILLMTLKAGGVGLNLTAADNVFLVDPWWNPAAEDQAADRAHRIGQTRPVFVHRLVTRGTVEEKILSLQETKRAAAEAALSGAENAVRITRDELMNLLS